MLNSSRQVDHSGQGTIFDAIAAAKARDAGIDLAESNKPKALLAFAREGAKKIALSRLSRECTADDVQQWLVDNDLDEGCLGNAAGSVFRGKEWRFTGQTVMSRREAAHRRLIRVWRYCGA